MSERDTIAAIATAPGPAGVAVVRVSGPDAFAVAAKIAGAAEGRAPAGARAGEAGGRASSPLARVRPLRDAAGSIIDATSLVLSFRAPHSYTGEDVVEFQCHGGVVTPRRVLEACFAAGARLAHRGEFTERAFLNGKLDYDQAESVLNLIEAKTDRAADAALEGLAGRRQRDARDLYEQALALSSELEHALDIDEGELPPEFFTRIRDALASLDASLDAALKRLREGRLLRDGALVVLAGPPNAGKSSLLNALVGESRAIVSDVPGTTRDSIEAWIDLEGWPIRLVDTAGLRETRDAIEAEGVARAEKLIEQAEVVIELTSREGDKRDARVASDKRALATDFTDCHGLGLGERLKNSPASLATLSTPASPQRLQRSSLKVPPASLATLSTPASPQRLPINAKCDLARSGSLLNVSAKTGEGLDALKREIVARLERRAADATAESSGIGDAERGVATLLAARQSLTPLLASDAVSLDLVLAGNAVRGVAESLGALVGATYSADLLDRLFSRFCVGK